MLDSDSCVRLTFAAPCKRLLLWLLPEGDIWRNIGVLEAEGGKASRGERASDVEAIAGDDCGFIGAGPSDIDLRTFGRGLKV